MRDSKLPLRRLGRVCTTISAGAASEMAEKAAAAFALGTDLVELRFDMLKKPSSALGKRLSHLAGRSVFTVRRRDEGGGFMGAESERLSLISALCVLRPLFVDVELRTAKQNPEWYGGLPKGCRKIVSWHDLGGTPGLREMKRARDEAGSLGDVAKIVTLAARREDNLRVLRLYEDSPCGLIAFCMGEAGTVSRLVSLQLGSPLAYASLPNEPVAQGQPSVTTLLGLRRIWERRGW